MGAEEVTDLIERLHTAVEPGHLKISELIIKMPWIVNDARKEKQEADAKVATLTAEAKRQESFVSMEVNIEKKEGKPVYGNPQLRDAEKSKRLGEDIEYKEAMGLLSDAVDDRLQAANRLYLYEDVYKSARILARQANGGP